MPLTAKGNKIMNSMRQEYGAKKGTSVFYASRNKGTIKDVDPESSHEKHKKIIHARRAMEDTLREQEDALLSGGTSAEDNSGVDDRKHGKLRHKGK
jgi:hypothetical protein